ncbi:MAG: 3-demethylubiquinone-9 3-O-methyltransferase [Planctomycetes bacterium]|nr:3-demethylubiquinone-9 3-O-methyltransferase [Planctomycetota bacterium]
MKNDLAIYDHHAADWWDPCSRFSASLHALNRVRLEEVRGVVGDRYAGFVVDLGCGGGLLSEPLARAGATVVGVDISGGSVRAASAHGADCPHLHYLRGDATRPPLPDACADLVVCADVVEHIPDWESLVATAARVAKPGARFYVNTINRTWFARVVTVWLGEGLGYVPRGTHDHRMFVAPKSLAAAGDRHGWSFDGATGQRVMPLRTLFGRRLALAATTSLSATYSAWFTRR